MSALTALALAAPAQAATYETSVFPNPFSYPETERLTYRLRITTAGQPERLRVLAGVPSLPWRALTLDTMTLEGPGTVLSSGGSISLRDRFCAPLLPDTHGSDSYFAPEIEVEIPANTTSTIALPVSPYRFMRRGWGWTWPSSFEWPKRRPGLRPSVRRAL